MKLLFAVDLAALTDVAALLWSESPMDEDWAALLLVSASSGVVVEVVGSLLSMESVSTTDVVPDVVVVGTVWLSTAELDSSLVVDVSSGTAGVVGVVVVEGAVVVSSGEEIEGVDVAEGVDVVVGVDGLGVVVGVEVVVTKGVAIADEVVVGVVVVVGDVVLGMVLPSASKDTPSSSEVPELRRVVVRTWVISSPFGKLDVVVKRLVRSDSNGVIVVVCSTVVWVVWVMTGAEELVTIRLICRGK